MPGKKSESALIAEIEALLFDEWSYYTDKGLMSMSKRVCKCAVERLRKEMIAESVDPELTRRSIK